MAPGWGSAPPAILVLTPAGSGDIRPSASTCATPAPGGGGSGPYGRAADGACGAAALPSSAPAVPCDVSAGLVAVLAPPPERGWEVTNEASAIPATRTTANPAAGPASDRQGHAPMPRNRRLGGRSRVHSSSSKSRRGRV